MATPPTNLAPSGPDPHEYPRARPQAQLQKTTFLLTGRIVDVCGGARARDPMVSGDGVLRRAGVLLEVVAVDEADRDPHRGAVQDAHVEVRRSSRAAAVVEIARVNPDVVGPL